jgi:putative hydrolase of the HAD superfamily
MERNSYRPEEVLVVGDDPESEIKAAMDLGIKAVLYDKIKHYPENASDLTKIADFGELHLLLSD